MASEEFFTAFWNTHSMSERYVWAGMGLTFNGQPVQLSRDCDSVSTLICGASTGSGLQSIIYCNHDLRELSGPVPLRNIRQKLFLGPDFQSNTGRPVNLGREFNGRRPTRRTIGRRVDYFARVHNELHATDVLSTPGTFKNFNRTAERRAEPASFAVQEAAECLFNAK